MDAKVAETDARAVLARITGRVQGVSYRVWARSEAKSIGVTGWVRNEGDGSVSVLVAGPKAKVSQMVDALWEGPAAASVQYVATEETDPGNPPSSFTIQ
jgi:acylphosphatase